jgi:murein DD-endopeptidase
MRSIIARSVMAIPILICASIVHADVSPRQSAVEAVAPKPPTPVAADGKRLLVYELHITNLGTVPLRLKRIDVAGGAPSHLHVDFTGDALAHMLTLIGGPKEDAPRLDIGRRIVAFIWIAVEPGAVPSSLRHRLTFDITDATSAQNESVIDDIVVPVAHDIPVVLSPPFADGDWLAGSAPSNASVHRRSLITLNGRAWISQRFAIDWVCVGANGNTFHDSRERNENFWAFGQPVHAVAGGEVTEAVDIYPDNTPDHLPPVTIENITGNHVIVRIAPATYILFAHLRHGSVRVKLHQRVKRGEVIAEVGNSGNTTGAHLHLQVMDASSPIAAEGIPFVFDHFTFLGNGSDFEETHHVIEPRRNEMPLEDVVVRFP